jgi:hypothetical protein
MQRREFGRGLLLRVIGILILTVGGLHYSDTLMEFIEIIYQNSFRTSQETHYVSATKPNRLMLFRETVAVYVRTIRNT